MLEQLRRITYHDVALHSKRRHATSRNENIRCVKQKQTKKLATLKMLDDGTIYRETLIFKYR